MSNRNDTTTSRRFKHLNAEKRAQIEILLKIGMPKKHIAQELGIARSTLYNELARGTVEQMDTHLRVYKKYFADAGQRVYENHRKNSRNALKLAKVHDFVAYAERLMLIEKKCPDTICGRVRLMGEFQEMVCAKTLYNYIDMGLLKVRNIDLPLRVKRQTKRDDIRKARRILGSSIEERPKEVENRTEPGHWEFDTIVGKNGRGEVILSLDERVSRKRHLIKISSRTAAAVREGVERLKTLYGDRFSEVFRSVTCDNGSEFAGLQEVFGSIPVYYAHPYAAFERGTNEKQNSLVRRFLPKGRSFDDVSDETIQRIEDWINNLPRKILNYKCANEVFLDFLKCPI